VGDTRLRVVVVAGWLMPVPVSVAVMGEALTALDEIVSDSDRVPVAVGEKVTPRLHPSPELRVPLTPVGSVSPEMAVVALP
jgi:hypothetical protein